MGAGTRPWSLTCRDAGRCWVLVYRILYRFLASLARLTVRSGRSKDLEIIVLRHQLGVLRRQVDRPELTDADRSLLGAIAAALPRPSRAGGLVTPDTLLGWHRRRIVGHWTQHSDRRADRRLRQSFALWVPETRSWLVRPHVGTR